MPTSHFEIDETPLAEAVFTHDATMFPAEPDVGIFRPYWEVSGEITCGKIGGLSLTREEMLLAFGEKEIARLEELETDALVEKYTSGELGREAAE